MPDELAAIIQNEIKRVVKGTSTLQLGIAYGFTLPRQREIFFELVSDERLQEEFAKTQAKEIIGTNPNKEPLACSVIHSFKVVNAVNLFFLEQATQAGFLWQQEEQMKTGII